MSIIIIIIMTGVLLLVTLSLLFYPGRTQMNDAHPVVVIIVIITMSLTMDDQCFVSVSR